MDVNVVCGKLLPGQGVVAAQAYLSTDGKCSLYGRPAIENPQSSQGLCSIGKTDFLIEEANFQHCFAFSPFDSNIKWSLLLLKISGQLSFCAGRDYAVAQLEKYTPVDDIIDHLGQVCGSITERSRVGLYVGWG